MIPFSEQPPILYEGQDQQWPPLLAPVPDPQLPLDDPASEPEEFEAPDTPSQPSLDNPVSQPEAFEVPDSSSQLPPDDYAPLPTISDATARHVREIEEATARADDELARMRELNDALRRQIAELQKPRAPRQPEEKSPTPLPPSVNARLGQIQERHPDRYEFEPATGLSSFNSDLLFDTGKDKLRPEARGLLEEFVAAFEGVDTRDLQIEIDGHTDNQPIGQPETVAKHPTNWHLSVHRAIAVERYLEKAGLPRDRIRVSGFSLYRPVAKNDSAAGRQRNRRVEVRVRSLDKTTSQRTSLAPETNRPSAAFSSSEHRLARRRLVVPSAVYAWRAAGALRR